MSALPYASSFMNTWLTLPFALLVVALGAPEAPTFRVHTVPLDAPPLRMLVAPFDAGPTPDVVVVLRQGFAEIDLLTLQGSGTGRLEPAAQLALQQLGYIDTPAMAAGHVDTDEWLDLGISSVGPDGLYLGDGDLVFTGNGWLPTYGGSQHGVGFTDYDDDGDLDSAMLVNDFGGWYLDLGTNDGDGNLSAEVFDTAPGTARSEAYLLFADVDGDGRDATFVVGGSGLAQSRFPGGPTTNELLVPGDLGQVVAAHLDGDDRLDLAVATREGHGAVVLLNDGSGEFPTTRLYESGRAPQSLAAADLDNDGDVDLAVAHRLGGDVGLLLGDGTGAFALAGRIAVGREPVAIASADLDLDGDADLIVALQGESALAVLLNETTP